MDTQNKDEAATACGPIAEKLFKLGMITTPPPIPHNELRTPATAPVGTATDTGIALLSLGGVLPILAAERRKCIRARWFVREDRAANILT